MLHKMIKIKTSVLKDFFNYAGKIPPNKKISISDYLQISGNDTSSAITYAGAGGVIKQYIDAYHKSDILYIVDISILKVAMSGVEMITISEKNDKIEIVGGSKLYHSKVNDPYMSLSDEEFKDLIPLNSEELDAINCANIVAPINSDNPNMNNVFIKNQNGLNEIAATNAFGLVCCKVSGEAKNMLLNNMVCSTLSLLTDCKISQNEAFTFINTYNIFYRFNNPDASPINYQWVLEKAHDGKVGVADFEIAELISFCEQCTKITPDKNVKIKINLIEGVLTLLMKDDFINVENSKEIDADILSSFEVITFDANKTLPCLKSISSGKVTLYIKDSSVTLIPKENENKTILFTQII